MKLTLKRPHYAVFDDVLPRAELAALQHYLQHEARLDFINRVEHLSVWSQDDGHPLFSPVVATELGKSGRAREVVRAGDGPYFAHPTGSALDFVLGRVLSMRAALVPWVGKEGRAWRTLTARAFVYPIGTGLDWHDDGGGYSGAFSFYVNAEWRPQWGGELLIAAPEKRTQQRGEFVLPVANRMVVLKGGVPHKVARVSSAAGSHHRASVSGFFARKGIDAVSDGTLVTDLFDGVQA